MEFISDSVRPQNAPRRSERLRAMGYYNETGTPRISYFDSLVSGIRSRRGSPGRASSSALANDGDCVTRSVKVRNHTCVDNSGWRSDFTISYHETHINQSLMAGNPVCFDNSSSGNPAGMRDGETPMNQSSAGGNHRHLTWSQLFSMMAVALFLVAAFAFGASALEGVRNDLRSLETDVQDLRNDLNEMRNTPHPETYQMRNTPHPKAYSRPDFALDAQGGRVVPDLSSKTFAAFASSMLYKADAPWLRFKTPSNVIRGQTPPLTPGHCWPFGGESGKLFITLGHAIHVTHVSLGHISKEQSPKGQILSAPKRFTVHGLKSLNGEETRLGTFEYDDSGDAIQTFKILDHTDEVFQHVKLVVESNYGNPFYTCLYNFKVHGQMP